MDVIGYLKGWTLIHSLVVAVVAFALASLIFKNGIINMVLWVVAIGAAIVGVINYLSYGR